MKGSLCTAAWKVARKHKSRTSLNFSFKLSTFFSLPLFYLRDYNLRAQPKTRQWKSTLTEIALKSTFSSLCEKKPYAA